MTAPKLRHSARAVILDEEERILLCEQVFGSNLSGWVAPGGGIDRGENVLEALRRELDEEVGLAVRRALSHVWHQEVVASGHTPGYDGFVNDYFLVRTQHFVPRGSWTDEQIADAGIAQIRWWSRSEIDLATSQGTLFSPRDLGTLLGSLVDPAPEEPLRLGL